MASNVAVKKRGRGRTVVANAGFLHVRVDEKTIKAIDQLSKRWNCERSVAVRRVICEAVQ